MPDGSGGAPGAVAEAIKTGTGKFSGAVTEELGKDAKSFASQMGLNSSQNKPQQSSQQQPNIQQMAQQDQQNVVEPGLANARAKLAQIQTGNKQSPQNQKQQTQVRDGNGQNPVFAKRLFDEVQGGMAYHPNRWGEEAFARQKQEEEQEKKAELQEEQQKEEEKKRKLAESPVALPGSGTPKGPGAKQKKKMPLAQQQAIQKRETGRNTGG